VRCKLLPFVSDVGQNAAAANKLIIDDIKGVGYFFLHVRNETKNQEAGLRPG
jgi:hypothetical protein